MKMRWMCILGSIAWVFATSNAMADKKYDQGATDTEIKIGSTNPYSGPASAYGTIGRAESAYFKMINDQGGVNGRKINFISLDDGYSPPRTVEQVRKLVEQEQVLLLAGTLGTPPNSAIHKYVNAKGVPQLFITTGANEMGRSEEFPLDHGVQPKLPGRSAHLRQVHPRQQAQRQRLPSFTRTMTTARTTSRA